MGGERAKRRSASLRAGGPAHCRMCLKEFQPVRKSHIFCTTKCSAKAGQLRFYGLSPEDYHRLIAASAGRCPICGNKPKRWNVDHNHKTGEVTGLVCSSCNSVLLAGSKHSIDVARGLLNYLVEPPVRHVLGGRFVSLERLKLRKSNWSYPRWTNGDNSRRTKQLFADFINERNKNAQNK